MTEPNPVLPPELLGTVERYAVYRCYSESGELLYIGETGELGRRLASHAQKLWFVNVRGITLEWYADELSALMAERRAIHVEHPKYNQQHRKTTSAQMARRKSRRQAPKVVTPRPDGKATQAEALSIYLAEPGISGSELGRRLGKSESYGCRLKREMDQSAAGAEVER